MKNFDHKLILSILTGTFCFFLVAGFGQTKVFWTNNTGGPDITSANLDGTAAQVIAPIPGGFLEDITYNPDEDKLYFMNGTFPPNNGIFKMNTDGSGIVPVLTNLMSPDGLDLDLCEGKIYYADSGPGTISRVNLDGTGVEVVVTSTFGVEGMAIDVNTQKIYWVITGGGTIMRANFDGTGVETVAAGLNGPIKLAKDMSTGVIYFTTLFDGNVSRVNGDGTGLQVLAGGFNSPSGIALDAIAGKLYIADNDGVSTSNLDGSGVTQIVADPGGLKLGLTLNDDSNACAPIPTLGEWGLIILALSFLIVGAVALRYRKPALQKA